MPPEKKQSLFPTYELVCNLLLSLVRILSTPAEMIMHRDVGERYLGISGALALVLMALFASTFPALQSVPVYLLMVVLMVRIVVHRIFCIYRRYVGGKMMHSRSAGTSLLGLLLKNKVPDTLMNWIEPALLVLLGFAIVGINKPLGIYLLYSGWGLAWIVAIRANMVYNKVLDALDAQQEQAAMAELIRERQRMV